MTKPGLSYDNFRYFYVILHSLFSKADKVRYSNDIHTVAINTIDDVNEEYIVNAAIPCVLTKQKEWEYEREYRLIFKPFNTVKYDPAAILSIIFGLRTSQDKIEDVLNATKHIKQIKYYKADLLPNQYKMIFRDL